MNKESFDRVADSYVEHHESIHGVWPPDSERALCGYENGQIAYFVDSLGQDPERPPWPLHSVLRYVTIFYLMKPETDEVEYHILATDTKPASGVSVRVILAPDVIRVEPGYVLLGDEPEEDIFLSNQPAIAEGVGRSKFNREVREGLEAELANRNKS